MRTVKAFLIYRASDQNLRVVKVRPTSLQWDEIAFPVQINVPAPWGKVVGSVVIDLPESGPPHIVVEQPEVPDA